MNDQANSRISSLSEYALLGRSGLRVSPLIARRPGVTSTIIGATKLDQLQTNMHALDLDIPAPLAAKLEEASRPEEVFPYFFFEPTMRAMLTGATEVRREPTWFRPR
jgi:hypothetical protein